MHSEKWGFSLAARTRTKKNRDIAADPDHDHTTCFPLPFFKAVHSVSLKNGWRLESLLLSLFNNVAFLEHRCTRLSSEVGQEIAQLSNVPEVASGPVPLPADAQAAAPKPLGASWQAGLLHKGSCNQGPGNAKPLLSGSRM
eukprot:s4513_g6.t1